jgi:endonuclease-3 related protein
MPTVKRAVVSPCPDEGHAAAVLFAVGTALDQAIRIKDNWYGETRDEVVIGAILTQNTNWDNVEKAMANLRESNLLSLPRLAEFDPGPLASLIRPSGYHNQKAQRLVQVARALHGACLPAGIAGRRSFYLSLKGIGPETADTILLYADRLPVFVIDAYTIRVCSCLGLCPETVGYSALQQFFERHLPSDAGLYQRFHAQLVHLAKSWCRRRSRCADCPLKLLCVSGSAYHPA